MLEGCQIIAHDWRYLFINEAAERQNHRLKEELLGKKYTDMWPDVESTPTFALIKRCMEDRVSGQGENEFSFPDGTLGWFSLSVQPVPEGIFILSIETTEHKQAVEALRSSEKKFFILFEKAAFAASLSRQADGVLVDVNEAFEKSFGYSKEEAIGKTSLELGINPDAAGRVRILAQLREGGAARDQELDLRTKAGELRTFSVNVDLMDIGDQKYILNTTQDITERKRAEVKILQRLQNIQALQKIDQAIAGSLDIGLSLHVVLEQTKAELRVDAASVLLFNSHTQKLEFAAGIGFRGRAIEGSSVRLGEGHAGRAAAERRMVGIADLRADGGQFARASFLADEGFAAYFATPLIAKGKVNGVLEIYHRSPLAPDEHWRDFFEVLAGQAAIAVDSASLFVEVQNSNARLFAAYDSTIEGWSHALDLRDKETEGHTQRVTEMTLRLVRAAGMTEEETIHVRRGALLHDIGKMGVPIIYS